MIVDFNAPEGVIKTFGFAANQHANYRAEKMSKNKILHAPEREEEQTCTVQKQIPSQFGFDPN